MSASPRRLGRYLLFKELASGGMATVYLGRLVGPAGFARAVAIKRLHAHLAQDPQFVAMFLDEARIAARIRHPNVVPTVDVVAEPTELFIVMEYVHGTSLSRVIKALRDRGDARLPLPIASAVAVGMLAGLHAAHEATSEELQPLGVVHRDVSAPNVLLGADGVPRLLDFGIAKAFGRAQVTRDGQVKGKLPYMAPEQLKSEDLDRRVDVWATGVVLWEMITGQRLFDGDDGAIVFKVLDQPIAPPCQLAGQPHEALDAVVLRALSRDRDLRFPTAQAMLEALERACPPASSNQLARWLGELVADELYERRQAVAELETTQTDAPPLTVRGAGLAAAGHPAPAARRSWLWAAAGALLLGATAAVIVTLVTAPEDPANAAASEPATALAHQPSGSASSVEATAASQAAASVPALTTAGVSSSSAAASSSVPSAPRPAPTAAIDCKKEPARCRVTAPAAAPASTVPKGGGI